MTKNGSLGRPGTRPKAMTITPATSGALRWSRICVETVEPRSSSAPAERVTRMPVATEISSAGIWAHRPSPIDSSEKCWPASRERHALLDDADDDAAEQVDAGDQDAGDRVALDELRGAVHRAVEVGLLGDLGAALARLFVGDLAGVQVGVDRHLLAGHGVQGEARADLGHAPGAVRDHDELDHDQDQEDDEADDDVAADDEVAERLDHVAGVALEQDQTRHGHVDRQAEERGQQQDRRERR